MPIDKSVEQIIVVSDLDTLSLRAAVLIVQAGKEAIGQRGQYMLALSGGRTPRPIFRCLASPPFRDGLSIAADSVNGVRKEKRIILIARFHRAEHKGINKLPDLLCDAMKGYTLVLLVGAEQVPSAWEDSLSRQPARHEVEVEVKYKLTDYERFRGIRRSSLMLSPSFFEAFGFPPVQARYRNVPYIAFDLPVLTEVSGNAIHYVEPGNFAQFRNRIEGVLEFDNTCGHLQDNVAEVGRFENCAERIDRVVQ